LVLKLGVVCTNHMCRSLLEFCFDRNVRKMFELAVAAPSSAMVVGQKSR